MASAKTTSSTPVTIHFVDELDHAFTMFVGPGSNAKLFEIGVVDIGDGPIIIHAMPARPRYLR